MYYILVVPPPTISIASNNPSLNLIRGTVRQLICNVTLTSPTPPSFNVSITLLRNGQLVDYMNNARIEFETIGNSQILTFLPLDTSDTGTYNCTGSIITTNDQSLIIGTSNSSTYQLVIEGIFNINYYLLYIYSYSITNCYIGYYW